MCCTVASMYPSIKKREKKKIAWKTSKVDSVTYIVVLLKDSSLMLTVSFQRLWRMDPPPLLPSFWFRCTRSGVSCLSICLRYISQADR
jgi:hypothetical protein